MPKSTMAKVTPDKRPGRIDILKCVVPSDSLGTECMVPHRCFHVFSLVCFSSIVLITQFSKADALLSLT